MDKSNQPRNIIHLDMDAFYPAVEVLDNPELKGKPIIVGGSRTRGVVSSASYEARKYGVHSAQPMATATRLCPQAIVMSVRMSRYREVSREVFGIFRLFTPLVEPLSIDEAFLDVTGSARLFGSVIDIAKKIKQMVVDKTGLTISAGVAPNKFLAKIASDLEKPDGLTIVPPDNVKAFLDPLPIGKMWGVGKKTQEVLRALNVKTFNDLSRLPVKLVEHRFGKWGVKMHQLAQGVDEREVIPSHEAKSIGHEETFNEDILGVDAAKKELLSLSNRVARRMRRMGAVGKTITLKVKYHDFVLITRASTLPEATDDGMEIYRTVCDLLNKTSVGRRRVRLLGVSLSQLNHSDFEAQLSLFERAKSSQKRKDLNIALDVLHEKFGSKGPRPGALLEKRERS